MSGFYLPTWFIVVFYFIPLIGLTAIHVIAMAYGAAFSEECKFRVDLIISPIYGAISVAGWVIAISLGLKLRGGANSTDKWIPIFMLNMFLFSLLPYFGLALLILTQVNCKSQVTIGYLVFFWITTMLVVVVDVIIWLYFLFVLCYHGIRKTCRELLRLLHEDRRNRKLPYPAQDPRSLEWLKKQIDGHGIYYWNYYSEEEKFIEYYLTWRFDPKESSIEKKVKPICDICDEEILNGEIVFAFKRCPRMHHWSCSQKKMKHQIGVGCSRYVTKSMSMEEEVSEMRQHVLNLDTKRLHDMKLDLKTQAMKFPEFAELDVEEASDESLEIIEQLQ